MDKQKIVVPFTQGAEIDCIEYSILLERAIVDFGADLSFGQAAEKMKEHYGINVPLSAVQNITKQHAKACYELQEKNVDLDGKKNASCLIGEMDGTMIPIVIFEVNKSLGQLLTAQGSKLVTDCFQSSHAAG